MWPLERDATRDCVRIGRHAVERWQAAPAGLMLAARQPLATASSDQGDPLGSAVRLLYMDPPRGAVKLVVESAWLPVVLVDTGGVLWTRTQVEALVRHRLGLLYEDADDPVTAWQVRTDHRPGDRYALGYGLPRRVEESLMKAARELDLRCAALLPAFTWGWHRLRPDKRWAQRTGWWLWPEQDRLLIARVARGRLAGLNAGAAPSDDPVVMERLIAAEGVRLGTGSPDDPLGWATWTTPQTVNHRTDEARIRCFSVPGQPQPAHVDGAQDAVQPTMST